jgi:radical SAM superfamily enzyme YgiQ (UPF0313 family)
MSPPRLLLVNPWITDVAAFDLWAWPIGLLYWAERLRGWGFEVGLVDCTDRHHPGLEPYGKHPRAFGTGKYHAERIHPAPEPVQRADRPFRRYGYSLALFQAELQAFETHWGSPPDALLISSRMTYWYPGVQLAIQLLREQWPDRRIPILLGGIYATLCPEHARATSGADLVLEGDAFDTLPAWLRERFPERASRIVPPDPDPETWPRPAFDLCHGHDALPLLTSIGCPHHCSYCASKKLAPVCRRRSPDSVFRELRDHHARWGTTDFAFYDDALLTHSEQFFEPLMDRVVESGLPVRFHTPNGVHYTRITPRLADKMIQAGVQTIRLSLETVSRERLASWNRPGDNAAFRHAVEALRGAGFERDQIGVYILAGVPGQTPDEIRDTIDLALTAGATPRLNEYSPIPQTREWPRALELSGPEIEQEPLWQNNSLYYTRPEAFSRTAFEELRRYARQNFSQNEEATLLS